MTGRNAFRHRVQRGTAALVAATVLSLVPIVAVAAAAGAAGGCESEKPTGSVTKTVCDDSTPPTTSPVKMLPAANDNGYIDVNYVELSFTGAQSTGDDDPLAFQCQFGTLSVPDENAWKPCTSPVKYDNLDDSGALPYHFFVRAIDSADQPIDAKASCGLLCTAASSDLPDYDSSESETSFLVDTTTPNTSAFLESKYYDDRRPDLPMVDQPTVPFRLSSNEGDDEHPIRYRCHINGASLPCADGITSFTNLSPGTQKLEVAAIDLAGNVDPTPATQKFSVPRNLGPSTGWKTVRQGGYFAGDFLESRQVGAQVTAPGRNVRELRLIAPAGPGLGKVQVKIGTSIWRTVNLHADTYQRFHVYEVRDEYDPLVSGTIRVRVKSLPGNSVARIDAILAR